MKTFEFENFELSELNTHELTALNGGGWIADLIEAIVYRSKCSCASKPTQMSGALSL